MLCMLCPSNLRSYEQYYQDCFLGSAGRADLLALSAQSKCVRLSKLLVSPPRLSTIPWHEAKLLRLGLCFCCATGWVLPLAESKELRLSHFPLKAIHWRGLGRRWSLSSRSPRHDQLCCTFSCVYVSRFALNLCETRMELLIYFIWGLWSLIKSVHTFR